MFLFSFLQVLDFSAHFFYKTKDYKVQFACDVKSFTKWRNIKEQNQATENRIVIPSKTQLKDSPSGEHFIKIAENKKARYISIQIPSEGDINEKSVAYADITDEQGKEIRYGVETKHGSSSITLLKRPVGSETICVRIYLYNKHDTKDAVFLTPVINFVDQEIHPIESTSKKVENHKNMYIETCHVTSEIGKISLNTMPLLNAFELPSYFIYPNVKFDESKAGYSIIPLVANGTHIAAFNILQDNYMHLWHYFKTAEYTTFEMNLVARNSTGADISYILWETETTSWTDAVEHFHNEFPEIYNVQPYWGLWAAFPRLDLVFPDNNDETDVYHVGFQWGADPRNMKRTVPNWFYTVQSGLHISIPYNKETVIEDLKKCEYPPGMTDLNEKAMHKLKCETALTDAIRLADGSLHIEKEDQPWNPNGILAFTYYDEKSRECYDATVNGKYTGLPDYEGLAFDSFRSGTSTYIDREKGYLPGNYVPYFLLDDDNREILPAITGLFESAKHYAPISPNGYMVNGERMMPELVKYAANVGFEIFFGAAGYDTLSNCGWFLNEMWGSRYTLGSRSMSSIENSHREVAFKFKEEYYSMTAAYGSASTYFSYNGATDAFFCNKADIEGMKPFMKRWMPALEEAFYGNIFYANQLGLVKSEMPKEKQVPKLDSSDYISTTSLWCQPKEKAKNGYVNCYVVAFIGHDKPHESGSNFHREMHITIDGKDPECIFMAEDMKCLVNGDGSVDVSIHGLPTNKTYRTSFIRFKRALSTDYPDYASESQTPDESNEDANVGLIVGVSVSVIAIIAVCIFLFFYLRKKQQTKENESDNGV